MRWTFLAQVTAVGFFRPAGKQGVCPGMAIFLASTRLVAGAVRPAVFCWSVAESDARLNAVERAVSNQIRLPRLPSCVQLVTPLAYGGEDVRGDLFLSLGLFISATRPAIMLLAKRSLQQVLNLVLEQRARQGCALDQAGFLHRIEAAGDSYDALYALALELRSPAERADWAYREPLQWSDIQTESARLDPAAAWPMPNLMQAAQNAEVAFLSSVCGCMLGKPIEVDPTLAELRTAGMACGEWPLNDYVSTAFLEALGRRHESSGITVRESLYAS